MSEDTMIINTPTQLRSPRLDLTIGIKSGKTTFVLVGYCNECSGHGCKDTSQKPGACSNGCRRWPIDKLEDLKNILGASAANRVLHQLHNKVNEGLGNYSHQRADGPYERGGPGDR